MPKGINISSPPRFTGEPEAQLGQMHTWLFQMVEQLNVAMSVVQAQESVTAQQEHGGSGEGSNILTTEDLNQQRDQLKSLIIKTAEIVRVEMQREIKRLESSYLALSDFGEYREEISREIEDTASGTVESYAASIGLESYIKDSADLKEWQAETNGYIRKGFIYRNEADVPVLGIAIGQNITTKAVTTDGLEQLEVSNQNMGFFTSEGLEFYVNGLRVAFFRNDGMEVNNATITGRLRIGNWEISHSNGLEIKWIGGE
jgi:hypothetical protein